MKLVAMILLSALAGAPQQPDVQFPWKDLIRFELGAGKLRADATPAPWLAEVIQGKPVTAKIGDAAELWRITSQPYNASQARPGGWMLSAAAQMSDHFGPRVVNVMPNNLSIIGEGQVHGKMMRAEFYLIGNQAAQLTLQELTDPPGAPRILREQSLAAMIQAHPAEVRRYVWPMLDAIGGEHVLRPRAVDIYRAFDKIQPDAHQAEQVKNILADFSAPDGARRDAASRKLAEMGAPAVLVLLRTDASEFSPEQKSRVDRFLAANTLELDPEKSRRDAYFLTDCLLDDDRRVRVAANEALTDLLGRNVEFPIDQDVSIRSKRAREICDSIPPAATQP